MGKTTNIKPINKRGYYEIDGELLPSVTTVIGKVLAKPQLRYWFGKVGLEEAGKISREAKSFGSAMHKFVAEYLREQKEPEEFGSSEMEAAWDIWKEYWDEVRVTPEFVEEIIHNGKYAGTCDFYGDNTIIDWKFSNGIYDSHKVQLGAYARIVGADKGFIVRVPKEEDDELEVYMMDKEELEKAAEVFDHLLEVFKWLKK